MASEGKTGNSVRTGLQEEQMERNGASDELEWS